MTALHIVFDGFPSPEGPRFIEVEDDGGRSVNAGEWRERADGFAELLIPDGWQDISTRPRDATVLVTVVVGEGHAHYEPGSRPTTYPAYIDDSGRICNSHTWAPDKGLDSPHWRSVAWMPLPEPRVAHASDCAVHNAPALPVGPCDCVLSARLASGRAGGAA